MVKSNFLSTKTAIILALSIGFLSCNSDDDPKPQKKEGNAHALITMVSGTNQSSSSYAQTFNLTKVGSSLDNTKAVEINPKSSSVLSTYNGSVYSKYNATLEKWDIDTEGVFYKTGSINFNDIKYPCNIHYWKKEVAFTGGNGMFKLAIFNPTSLKRTGFIDLTKFSKMDLVTNLPETGDKVTSEAVSEMIIRDHYMYVAQYYRNGAPGKEKPALNKCYLIVVDLDKVDPNSSDNSDAVIKEISDPRGSFTGAWGAGSGSKFMQLDEKGDIYVLCHNLWSSTREVSGQPACALRIPKGKTDFDKDYYFDMEAASGGGVKPVFGFEYAGDGTMFALAQNSSKLDPNSPWSYYYDPIYQWYKFDLRNKKAVIVSETFTKQKVTLTYFEDGYAYLPIVTKDESYIMKTNVETLKTEKLFTTVGAPVIFKIK